MQTARVAKDYTNDYRAAYFHTLNQASDWWQNNVKGFAPRGDGADDRRRQNRKDYIRHSVGAANWYRTSNPSLWTTLP